MDLIRFGLIKTGQILEKGEIMFSFFINCHVKPVLVGYFKFANKNSI